MFWGFWIWGEGSFAFIVFCVSHHYEPLDIYIFNLFRSVAVIILTDTQIAPSLAQGRLFKLDLCSCDRTPLVLVASFPPGITRCPKFITYVSCPRSGVSHFSKES